MFGSLTSHSSKHTALFSDLSSTLSFYTGPYVSAFHHQPPPRTHLRPRLSLALVPVSHLCGSFGHSLFRSWPSLLCRAEGELPTSEVMDGVLSRSRVYLTVHLAICFSFLSFICIYTPFISYPFYLIDHHFFKNLLSLHLFL